MLDAVKFFTNLGRVTSSSLMCLGVVLMCTHAVAHAPSRAAVGQILRIFMCLSYLYSFAYDHVHCSNDLRTVDNNPLCYITMCSSDWVSPHSGDAASDAFASHASFSLIDGFLTGIFAATSTTKITIQTLVSFEDTNGTVFTIL